MNVRVPLLAASLLLPLAIGGCAPAGTVMLPPGVCNPSGAAVMFGYPDKTGQVDTTRYSTANCKK
ncbi:hypothetical protein GCM10011611_41590 [Aliidongia dinghuensis]|uniref:Lipoprotein n=1 Tax=Aliidongia dinghuensis TaxID=1867774 RepID=A0A8J2YXC6_9PROT|nr:hypothetical protein [Aliidongia dinghuensis]GGF31144.1 hypothetical protein GCM10011611_41590 [Aliidongia dinghuensis]